jgi:hypothetical protein
MAIGYKKTELGSIAITERSILPDPKMRTLLILVDGKKTRDDLIRMGAALGEVESRLDTLLQQGWIEEVRLASAASAPAPAAAPAAAAPRSTAPAPAAPAPQASGTAASVNLPDLKRQAVRQLTDLIGPAAEFFAMKIEGAKTGAQLRLFVERAAESVMASHGRTKALEYYNAIVSRIPPE